MTAACEAALPLVVRDALPGDAVAWRAHLARVVDETPWLLQTAEDPLPSVTELERMLTRYGTSPGSLALIAERPGPGRRAHVVGTLTLAGGLVRRLAHAAELSMSVIRAAWRTGVGTALLGEALTRARADASLLRLSLSVMASNTEAIRLYERHGFVREGRLARYVRVGPLDAPPAADDGHEDLIPMGLWLGGANA
jgi:RimJ/RimL family protein N-acetyltransferase